MNKFVDMAFDFLKKKIGMKNIMLVAFFSLGVYATLEAKSIIEDLVVTPDKLSQEMQAIQVKQDKTNTGFQIQLNESSMRTLSDQIFQLKKLKIKKMADELDLEMLDEYKKQYDSLKAETDSLKKTLYKTIK